MGQPGTGTGGFVAPSSVAPTPAVVTNSDRGGTGTGGFVAPSDAPQQVSLGGGIGPGTGDGGFVTPPAPGGAPAAPASPLPSDSSGIFGFLAPVSHALEGLGQAGYDLGKTIVKGDLGVLTDNQKEQQQASDTAGAYVKGIAKNYAQRYGPLVHGQIGKFGEMVYNDPIPYLLDAASAATLGGAGAAKAGSLLEKAGAISSDSRLAQLGKPVNLTVPDWNGEATLIKQSSANPVIRARQVIANKLMQKTPDLLPGGGVNPIGNSARLMRALSPDAERAAARLNIAAEPATQAFGKLSLPERAAYHMGARGLDPAAYKSFIAAHPDVSPAMLKILDNPKVAELVVNPSPKLADALAEGRALSDRMTAAKLEQGLISEHSAAESPYHTLRLMSGATVVPKGDAVPSPALRIATANRDSLAAQHEAVATAEAKWASENGGHLTPGGVRVEDTPAASNPFRNKLVTVGHQLQAAQAKVDRLAKPALETGVVGGKPIEQIAKELAAAGKEQPFYVPDSAYTAGMRGGRFSSKPSGFAEPTMPGSSKQNLGVFASKGMINVHADALGNEMRVLANRTEASALHDEIVKHAAELPKGTPLPAGYEYLKLNSGESTAPYTERMSGQFEKGLDPAYSADKVLTHDATDPNIATRHGNRLIVPSTVRQILESKAVTYNGALQHLLYNQPLSVWKHLVLGLRPMFFGNITVGNSILGALQMAPGFRGVAGWLNQVVPGAEKVLGSKLTDATMTDVLPEQKLGTFGGSVGMSKSAITGSSKLARGASRAYQGVMPATIAYENVLRRAMAEGWAKASPEVQSVMRANGGDVNAALQAVANTHPQVINDISARIDDAFGNYRSYNKLERAIKQFVPFYGWDRHIVSSMARLALERPQALDALLQAGEVGAQRRDAQLGSLPSYMSGDVKLPGLPGILGGLGGRQPVLNTGSLNPFNTFADLLQNPVAAAGLSPIIDSLIEEHTGRSSLTGAKLKQDPFLSMLEDLPQVRPVLEAAGVIPPTKPTSLYQSDWRMQLSALLGLPVKAELPETAHLYASERQ